MKQFIYILFLLPLIGVCQNIITIKGNVKDYSGDPSGVSFFNVDLVEEFVTQNKVLITQGKLDDHGNFEVKFSIDETELIFLDFGKVERSLYCTPGKSYFIEVRGPFIDLAVNHGVFSKDVKGAMIKNASLSDLNFAIDSLEQTCSYFLFNNWDGRKSYNAVKEFTDSISEVFEPIKNKYFNTYLTYKIAELEQYFYKKKRKEFAEKYFEGKSGIAKNIKSYQVFESYFKGNFKTNLYVYREMELVNKIAFGELDSLLQMAYPTNEKNNVEMQELAFLLGINEIKSMEEFRKKHFNKLLDTFIKKTNFPHHKIIAENIKNKLNRLEPGSKAPRLFLENNHTTFDIRDDFETYTYLCFFKSWDETVIQELKIMNYLQRKFEDQLKVVAVSTDIDTSHFTSLKRQFKTNELLFELYHYNYDSDILLNYDIRDFRLDRYDEEVTQKYFFIGPDGKIISASATKPSKGFEYKFKSAINP